MEEKTKLNIIFIYRDFHPVFSKNMIEKLLSLGCLISVECARRYGIFGWTRVDLTPNEHEIIFRTTNYLFFSELTYIDNDQYIKQYIRDFLPMKVVYDNTEVDLDYNFGIFDDDNTYIYIRKN